MTTPERPALPDRLTVLDGTDIDGEWERFEVFEALHHDVSICNPMSSADLDRVVEGLMAAPAAIARPHNDEQLSHLDIACGTGELIARLRARGVGQSTGVDLSPWMLAHAARRNSSETDQTAWILGNARQVLVNGGHDLVSCLGAEWIWHGGLGTLRALASHTRPGGRLAMGEMYLRDGLDPTELADSHGSFLTGEAMLAVMAQSGLRFVERIDTADESFDAYLERTGNAARQWADRFPGVKSQGHLGTHAEWVEARRQDSELLTWSVWIAEKLPD